MNGRSKNINKVTIFITFIFINMIYIKRPILIYTILKLWKVFKKSIESNVKRKIVIQNSH